MSSSQEVLFLRNVNGESKWFEDGDEENDGKYIGEIKNGKPNGTGTITSPDSEKYVGEWKDGERNGQGVVTSPDGWRYSGEFKNGKLHGRGIETLTNGEKYEGEFKDNKHWNGTGYNKDGKIVIRFVKGKLIEQ